MSRHDRTRNSVEAAKALRQAGLRLKAAGWLNDTERRVAWWLAANILGWSRLQDEYTVTQIAEGADLPGGAKYQRRRVGEALTALAQAGVIEFPTGRKGGRRPGGKGRGVLIRFPQLAAEEDAQNPSRPGGHLTESSAHAQVGGSPEEPPTPTWPNPPLPRDRTPHSQVGTPRVSLPGGGFPVRGTQRFGVAHDASGDAADDPLTISIEGEASAAAQRLIEHLGEAATTQTVDRLLGALERGAPAAAFHDALHRLRTMSPPPRNAAAYACQLVSDYVGRMRNGDAGRDVHLPQPAPARAGQLDRAWADFRGATSFVPGAQRRVEKYLAKNRDVLTDDQVTSILERLAAFYRNPTGDMHPRGPAYQLQRLATQLVWEASPPQGRS